MAAGAGWVTTLLLLGAGLFPLLAGAYLMLLALASFKRMPAQIRPVELRLAVLIPAHDEAELLGRCIAALRAQTYPDRLARLLVIADNCSDGTAEVAAGAGAEVMVRREPTAPGKGRALRWAMDRLLDDPAPPDAFVVVDADSVAEPDLLAALAAAAAAGAEVAQAEYLVLDDGSRSARLELQRAAFLLFHRVRLGGRRTLGMPANLVGNGMLLSRRAVIEHPWDAYTGAEDLEQSVSLRLAGVRPRFVPEARVLGPMPSGGRGAVSQRLRWEGGRFQVVRTRLVPLIVTAARHRRLDLIEAAIDLAVPPLGLLAMVAGAGLAGSLALALLRAVQPWAAVPWVLAALLLAAFVLAGLRSADAGGATYRALLVAPLFLAQKLAVYARLSGGLDAGRWQRTERPGELRRRRSARFMLLGIPIDPVDRGEALARIAQLLARGGPAQVCTVNLDFLVRARTNPEVRRLLQSSELNVADGAPVLWLSRLLGHHLPGRVTGVDLVPGMVAAAAGAGHGVFLLGGQRGAARAAAAALEQPDAECLEPASADLDGSGSEDILTRVEASGAGLVLVAFGHPKQELWISRNRGRLPVAVGVGGSFDIVSGRIPRAPGWMQAAGLEWSFRLAHEPGRLARRYLTDATWLFLMIPMVLLQRLLERGGRPEIA